MGGVGALAAVLDVAPSAPSMWKARGNVPAEHCPTIERATRVKATEKGDPSLVVTCEELRPDVAWSVLRGPSADAAVQATGTTTAP
jgi:DNA-binding transcriptional regulator YdaS (Cro superfamily)